MRNMRMENIFISEELKVFILERKKEIQDLWFHLFVQTYPPESRRFLEIAGDPFDNPVGSTCTGAMDELLTELGGQGNIKCIGAAIERITQIEAVQRKSLSEAVNFVSLLVIVIENIYRDTTGHCIADTTGWTDDIFMLARDSYARCRARIDGIQKKFRTLPYHDHEKPGMG